MSYEEHQLQAACVRWFRFAHRALEPLLFAIPNGGKRSRWEAAQVKAEGLVAGVADLALMVPASGKHGAFIEMKKETTVWKGGKPTTVRTYQRDSQREWQKAVEAQGYAYMVCRSFDDFHGFVEDYLADRYGVQNISQQ